MFIPLLDFSRKTKSFLSFPIYHQQNNMHNKSGHKITNGVGGQWWSGGVLCVVDSSYSENVLTLFIVMYCFLSDAFLGQSEWK